jgi:ATP-binding cassette subfamily B protein
MSIYPSPNIPKPGYGRTENDWWLFWRLIPYARRHVKLLVLSISLLVPMAIANSIQPILVGQAISLIRHEPSTYGFLQHLPLGQALTLVQVLLLLTMLVRLSFTGVQGYLVQKLGQNITAEIRNDIFNHITSLAVSFFDRTPVGKLITRLTSDVESLGDVFATGAIGIVADFLSMLVIISLMFFLQWQLASLLLSILLPISWIIVYLQKKYRKANYKAREQLSKINSQLQENIAGINVVQLFRREKYNTELFRATTKDYNREVEQSIWYESAVSATLEWIGLVAVAGVLGIGGWLLVQQNLTFGVLSTFILYAQQLFEPLRNFAEKFTVIQGGFTAIERVSEILAEKIEITNIGSSFQVPKGESQDQSQTELGEIRFEHVWFAYQAGDYVIKDLDFIINPREKIALVGPTGAGKSSVIRLLCRLYEPTAGRILIDGVDIRNIPQTELRRYVGVILQEAFLFAGDVKSNISLGDDYEFADIERAAKETNIDRFIQQLPQGYDTYLRQRGTNLSSGQKQLLAFARAAIRQPQILVLDEATASLDVVTEAVVQEALNRLLENRTAIIIAHRLSTIRNVDRIFVLKRGELIEQGSHDHLLKQDGLYASLHRQQI